MQAAAARISAVQLGIRTLLIGAALVLAFLAASPLTAQAQSSCPSGTSEALGTCRCERSMSTREGSLIRTCYATTSGGTATGATTTSQTGTSGTVQSTTQVDNGDGTFTQTTESASLSGKCVHLLTTPISCIKDALVYGMSAIVGGLAFVVLAIASFILWVVGGMFNWVVIKTVFEFGSTFGASDGMLVAWGILRDIGNIVLLFGFIFMGIATILNTHALDEYSARKALPRLIIFAVLLNFSLFAAQIVIDVSNSMAAVFTAQAGLTGCTTESDTVDVRTGLSGREACANNGIAGQVIQMAGVSSVWSLTNLGDFMSQPQKHAPVYIGLAIFVTVTAVVLLAAAIMLVFRAVMLCLLMVLSPIGFAGMAIPPLQEFARSWWSKLLSNAFFAPIYLLLVLISLKIVDGLVGPNDGGSFAKAMIEGSTNAPQIFVIFAVVIGFMVASLIVAKNMGAAGASFATKTAGGAVLGAYGFVGRRTLGSASVAAGNRIRKSRYLTEVNPGLGRFLSGVADKGANSSFSARNLATKAGAGAGLNFGKASKDVSHGIHGIEENAVKSRVEFAKSFKGRTETDKDVEERTQRAAEERETARDEIDERLKEQNAASSSQQSAQAEVDKQERIVRQLQRQADNTLRATGTHDAALEERVAEAQKELKKKEGALAEADKKLSTASDALAKAREKEAKAAEEAADTSYRNISKDDQQRRYAEKMEHSGLPWPSVDSHANHEAADKIKKNAGKSDIERALDTIKEKTEQKKDDHADDHGGGGGDHGGGGGHGGGPKH